jgi:hypothetical protein
MTENEMRGLILDSTWEIEAKVKVLETVVESLRLPGSFIPGTPPDKADNVICTLQDYVERLKHYIRQLEALATAPAEIIAAYGRAASRS